jgi:hypothetical protein
MTPTAAITRWGNWSVTDVRLPARFEYLFWNSDVGELDVKRDGHYIASRLLMSDDVAAWGWAARHLSADDLASGNAAARHA